MVDRARWGAALRGPRLQLLNLAVFLTVVELTLDFPNPLVYVLLAVGLAAALDGVASRARYGEWRVPWASMVAATGASLLIDGRDAWAFVLLPVLLVGSKHLIRWRGQHLFNPNNFAIAVLLVAGLARVGVNEWGAAPQALALIVLFGTIATSRVKRFDLALAYLGFSGLVYFALAQAYGWSAATAFAFAFSPLHVMMGFFAITDPATSPAGRIEKLVFAALIVLLGVPGVLGGRAEAAVFALLVAAPQRHLIVWLVRRRWPTRALPTAPTGAAP